ncbi:hypothetical protein BH09VER1_BH09VER1_24730 [soil metagenome]
MASRTIKSPGWAFDVKVEGNDLIVENTTGTWFGGDHDPDDDGQTASGINTKGNPGLLGCSLPMNYQGPSKPTVKAVGGSPIPMLPYRKTQVIVTSRGKSLTVPLIDIGPAKWAKDGIDLTRAAFVALGGALKQGVIPVSYRIIGGALFLK